jgi:hypothetical protein
VPAKNGEMGFSMNTQQMKIHTFPHATTLLYKLLTHGIIIFHHQLLPVEECLCAPGGAVGLGKL